MTVSLQDIYDLQQVIIGRLNGGGLAAVEAAAAQAQDDYDALAADLPSVVRSEMHYVATVDPDAVEDRRDGGVFRTLSGLTSRAPAGARIIAQLVAGKTHVMDYNVTLQNQSLRLSKSGAGDDPILDVRAYETGGLNAVYAFQPNGMCQLKMVSIDVRLPTAKVNAGVGWSGSRSLLTFDSGCPTFCALTTSKVTGGIAGTEIGLMSNVNGGQSHLGLYQAELDGPLFGIVDAGQGISMVSRQTLTLSNGAQLANANAVLGTNLLDNAA